jgi:regulator of nucleoside diphosphate kinase
VESRIVVSRRDLLRLRALLGPHARAAANDRDHLFELEEEIDRATVVGAEALPTDVVALESTVIVLDVQSGSHASYTLVLPAQADIAEGRVSVLAPLGTALLGCRVGDEVEQRTPGGVRRLRIRAVQQAPPADDEPRRRRRAAA